MALTDTALVLAGHGSRAAEANAALAALAAALGERLGVPVLPAYLEMTEPAIPAALDAAVGAGARRVLVLPYFLGPGMHVRRDLVEIVAAAGARHPAVGFELTDFLGAHPGIVELLAAIGAAALARQGAGGASA